MKKSAGILLYKKRDKQYLLFLVHPGGPFWKNKDAGAWSIPKGEYEEGEEPLAAAKREFREETGIAIDGHFRELEPVRQKSGKWVHCWAVEGDADASAIRSNTFPLTWPPGSGRTIEVPEVDRAAWFPASEALEKINPGQAGLIHQLLSILHT